MAVVSAGAEATSSASDTPCAAAVMAGAATSALEPLKTRKYRLPTPAVDPWLSVTTHAIVCRPLPSDVVSKAKSASADDTPGYCAEAKSEVRSARAAHTAGDPTAMPSISTLTPPPPVPSAHI